MPTPPGKATPAAAAATAVSSTPRPGAVIAVPKTLAESDFTILARPKKQAICMIFGSTGEGKTTFALRYTPQPVALINFDGRSEDAVCRETTPSRSILFLGMPVPTYVTRLGDEDARRIGQLGVDKTFRNLEFAVNESRKGNVRTIVLDTGTELDKLINLSISGRVDRLKRDYGKSSHLIALEWGRVFSLAQEGKAHLVILSRAKAVWAGDTPTGEFTFDGSKHVDEGVKWAGHWRIKKSRLGLKSKTAAFELKITKAGQNLEELGNVYTADDWEDFGGPFVYANMLQVEGSEEGDWK